MREILLLVVFLGVLFSFLWLVVLGVERLLERKKVGGIRGGTEVEVKGDAGVRAAVVAGIMAYEEGVGKRGVVRREKKRRKEEEVSWWKKFERMR